jgi:hypothetical protein
LKNKWGGFFLVLRGIFGKSFCVFLPFPFPVGVLNPLGQAKEGALIGKERLSLFWSLAWRM